jgi:cell division cycle 14
MMSKKGKDLFLRVVDRVYLSDVESSDRCDPNVYHTFTTSGVLSYNAYCDDFGPMNLASVLRYIQMLELELSEHPDHKIVHYAEPGKRNMTNAAFLLGSYLILVHKLSPEQTWARFQGQYNFEPYRDATFSAADFGLTLLDCWRGLACGQALGWIGPSADDGLIDLDEYEHYDSFLNGELHIVVPDKFVAFRGPKTLEDGAEYADIGDTRIFSAPGTSSSSSSRARLPSGGRRMTSSSWTTFPWGPRARSTRS